MQWWDFCPPSLSIAVTAAPRQPPPPPRAKPSWEHLEVPLCPSSGSHSLLWPRGDGASVLAREEPWGLLTGYSPGLEMLSSVLERKENWSHQVWSTSLSICLNDE